MAFHALQALDGCPGFQAVRQNGHALGVASAAAHELDIENVTVDQVKANFGCADPLGLVGVVFIHGVGSFPCKNITYAHLSTNRHQNQSLCHRLGRKPFAILPRRAIMKPSEENEVSAMLHFRNDYGNGAHPKVMDALCKTNLELTVGYGQDPYCRQAADRIRDLCDYPNADVHFLVGGTQVNKTALGAFLRPWEAVIAADSGHIQVHETGAIEHNGHRIFTLPVADGKITPDQIRQLCRLYGHEETAPAPKLVYISNTTELGTLYTRAELQQLRQVCDEWGLYLYCDGARLACAMAVSGTTFADYAALCDAFTIGGTKNGLLFGEALVITNPALMPDFRRCLKQQGAMLAKGRLLGVQFAALMEDGLYFDICAHANRLADQLREVLAELGYGMYVPGCTNQVFPILPDALLEELGKSYTFTDMGRYHEHSRIVRFCTSWATKQEAVDGLCGEMRRITAALKN